MAFNPEQQCARSLVGLKPYQPGKSVGDLRGGAAAANPIKLSSNENALGPSRAATDALQQCADQVHLYPSAKLSALKTKLAQRHRVSKTQITLGNGSNELLEFVARCFLDANKNAVYSQHAFEIYALATRIAGAAAHQAIACPPDAAMPYGHDGEQIVAAVDHQSAVVFIANPNNPTGTWLSESQLKELLHAIDENVVVVVDQAYAEYAAAIPDYPDAAQWLDEFPNLIVTQTFSKIHALAGLRIGYALASPEIGDLFNRIRQPFNINAAALAAATATLDDSEHLAESLRLNAEGLRYLRAACDKLGLNYLPSAANFLCIEVGSSAPAIYQALLEQGVIIRLIQNYALPNHLRVTVGLPEHNARFIATLQQALQCGDG